MSLIRNGKSIKLFNERKEQRISFYLLSLHFQISNHFIDKSYSKLKIIPLNGFVNSGF